MPQISQAWERREEKEGELYEITLKVVNRISWVVVYPGSFDFFFHLFIRVIEALYEGVSVRPWVPTDGPSVGNLFSFYQKIDNFLSENHRGSPWLSVHC